MNEKQLAFELRKKADYHENELEACILVEAAEILEGIKNPNIKTICNHLDIQVLHDFDSETGKELVALGAKPELSAGFHGCEVTSWFNSLDELEKFCEAHLERFLSVKEDELPDAFNWK